MNRIKKSIIFLAVLLVAFFTYRLMLYGLYYKYFAGLGFAEVVSAFFNGIRFDLSITIVLFSLPLLLMNIPLRFLDKGPWFSYGSWLLFALSVAICTFLAVDLIYFGYVKRHIAGELLQLGNDTDMLVHSMSSYWGETLLLLAFIVILFRVWRRLHAIPLQPFSGKAWIHYSLFVLILTILGRGGLGLKPINVVNAYSTGNTEYGNLVLNGVFTAAHASRHTKSIPHRFFSDSTPMDVMLSVRQVEDRDYPMMQRSASHTGKQKTNLVFILLESWSEKYIDSFTGNNTGLTPHFDQLAKDGLRFTRFYSAGQRSIEGIQAILTGVPIIIGMPTLGRGLEANTISRLGTIAQDNGYHTLMLQASKRNSFRLDAIAAATGFEEYYGMEDMPPQLPYSDANGSYFGWDYELFQTLFDKLDQSPKPTLAFAYTGTTHFPYPAVPPQFQRFPHDSRSEQGFMNTLIYADWALGEFMDKAKQQPWFNNTIFVITADHPLGKFHVGEFDSQFHIPLLIYAPGLVNAGTNAKVGSQMDLFPTIIDLLGFQQPFAALGNSLLSKQGGYAYVTQGSEMIGLIDAHGYVSHSLKNRLQARRWDNASDANYFDQLQRRLLGLDQLSYEVLTNNRWAK